MASGETRQSVPKSAAASCASAIRAEASPDPRRRASEWETGRAQFFNKGRASFFPPSRSCASGSGWSRCEHSSHTDSSETDAGSPLFCNPWKYVRDQSSLRRCIHVPIPRDASSSEKIFSTSSNFGRIRSACFSICALMPSTFLKNFT